MRLDEVKELVEKGLTNEAIAGMVHLSIRQVQRLKRRLLESPTKSPKNTKDLLRLLAKKSAQGDLIAIRTLLKEFKELNKGQKQKEGPNLTWWMTWLTDDEKDILMTLFFRAAGREEKWQGRRNPTPEEIEALAEAERREEAREETPTPPGLPSQGSTDVDDSQPPTSPVGDSTPGESDQSRSHLVNTPEGRELPPSPLEKDGKRGTRN